MVPSWTETLIECSVETVGRTRFCIHPAEKVRGIPAVGGTKDLNLSKFLSLKADLLILDREENTKAMSEAAVECEIFVTHITQLSDVAPELSRLATRLNTSQPEAADRLNEIALRWKKVETQPAKKLLALTDLPGVEEWFSEPGNGDLDRAFVYVIWREPWMAAGPGTFISSVLEKMGVSQTALWPRSTPGSDVKKYPEFTLEELPAGTVLLFSSEPYPFGAKKVLLRQLTYPSCLINGESYSWFGIRTLKFLERHLLSV